MDIITNHQISNLVSRNDRGRGKGSQEAMYQIKCDKGGGGTREVPRKNGHMMMDDNEENMG
jgi:hypothetical protein